MTDEPFRPPAGWVPKRPAARNYPLLSRDLKRELAQVIPSRDGQTSYWPCEVTLVDGDVLDRVYIASATDYIRHWGVWPEDDPAKSWIDIGRVVHVRESPTRLPVRFAEQIYLAGESAMGGCFFALEFSDGVRQSYVTGNAVDFIPYPGSKAPRDIVRVHPHTGRNDQNQLSGSTHYWCLYGSAVSSGFGWRFSQE